MKDSSRSMRMCLLVSEYMFFLGVALEGWHRKREEVKWLLENGGVQMEGIKLERYMGR